jgi:GntR family transcriptional repressor for pyruvate dehydrogenase complex
MPAYPEGTSDISAALGSLPSGSAVSAVAKRMLDLFTTGDIAPGTRLPPERELAATLSIGRSTVREALAALEILGIVDIRSGSGTYLRGNSSELLPETLSWGLMLGEPKTRELIELRGKLEVAATELAAERITEVSLGRLRSLVNQMEESITDRTKFIEADLKFHLEIARAADNEVLLNLLQSIRSLLRIWVERGLQGDGDAQSALDEHQRVYEALASGDAQAARLSMQHHMDTAAVRLGNTLDRDDSGLAS